MCWGSRHVAQKFAVNIRIVTKEPAASVPIIYIIQEKTVMFVSVYYTD